MVNNLILIVGVLIYMLYISWEDIKTREANTIIHIIALFGLATVVTFNLYNTGDGLIQEYLIKGLLIGAGYTAFTVGIVERSVSKESLCYTFPIFFLLGYLFVALTPSHGFLIPIVLVIPGIMMWDVMFQKKAAFLASSNLSSLIWIVVFIGFLIMIYPLLTTELSVTNARVIVFINFVLPVMMQMRSHGFGNGDVLLIWVLTAVMMILGDTLTAGYGILLYASLFYIIFIVSRIVFHLRKDDADLCNQFAKHVIATFVIAIAIAVGLFVFNSRMVTYVQDTMSGIVLIIALLALIQIPMIIGIVALNKYIKSKMHIWDPVQEYVEGIPTLRQEPFAVEITCGFVLALLIGTPGTVFLNYVPIPGLI